VAVNLVANPGDRLVDPSCGSGTLLYEGLMQGLQVQGYDLHWRWASASRENLAHFGFEPSPGQERLASVGDASQIEFQADVVIANLPYGRRVPTTPEQIQAILSNLAPQAERFAFFSGHPLKGLLEALGYEHIEEADLSRGPGRQRYLSIAGPRPENRGDMAQQQQPSEQKQRLVASQTLC